MKPKGIEAWGPVLMMGLLQSALTASLPWLIEFSGLAAGVWSLVMAAGMLPVLLGAPWWGNRADRWGSNRVLRLATLVVLSGYGLLMLVLAMKVSAGLLMAGVLLARLVHGLGAGGVFPAAQRLAVSGFAPQRWALRLAGLQVAGHVGRILGPGLMVLAVVAGVPTMLWLVGLLALILSLGTLFSASGTEDVPESGGRVSVPSWGMGLPIYSMALVLTIGIGLLQFVLGPVIASLPSIDAQTATSLTGVALVISSIVAVIAGPLVHRWVGSGFWLGVIWLMAFAAGTLTLVVGANRLPALMLGVALVALGAAVISPWYGSLLRRCWPEARGLMAGRLTSLHTLGYGLGTLAGGGFLQWLPDQPMVLLTGLAPLLLLTAVWMDRAGLTCRHQTAG